MRKDVTPKEGKAHVCDVYLLILLAPNSSLMHHVLHFHIQPPPNAHPLTISTSPCTMPTLSPSFQTAGLGGMKPNTLVLGFYSRDLPVNTLDTLHRQLLRKSKVLQYIFREKPLEKFDSVDHELPSLRTNVCEHLVVDTQEYLLSL